MSIPTQDSFAAFGGPTANFNVLTISRSRQRKAAYSVRHAAYGNLNLVQLGGRLEAGRHFTLYVPSQGELDNLDQCLGQQGALSYAEGTVTAALVEYDSTEWFNGTEQLVSVIFITDAD